MNFSKKLEESFFLQNSFEIYGLVETGKKVISESAGDRAQREDADITNIRKLAGI